MTEKKCHSVSDPAEKRKPVEIQPKNNSWEKQMGFPLCFFLHAPTPKAFKSVQNVA
jgi:hypothetical protein